MHILKNRVLNRTDKKPIVIDTFYSEEKTNQPIVIFCHGYKGYKNWGAWDIMAHRIAKAGFCFVKFNFSHNGGTVENPIDFPDLEAFGHNNYTKELDDLNDVINWVETSFSNNKSVNTQHICLFGHSRGGGISIIKTAEDKRIKTLITLASISDFEARFGSKTEILSWKKEGVKFVANRRTQQQMPHYYPFYEDFMANKKRLHIANSIKKVNVPHLIIHGENDTTVSINEAKKLHQWNPNAAFQIIKNADHVFNTKQPWTSNGLPPELASVCSSITAFLSK